MIFFTTCRVHEAPSRRRRTVQSLHVRCRLTRPTNVILPVCAKVCSLVAKSVILDGGGFIFVRKSTLVLPLSRCLVVI